MKFFLPGFLSLGLLISIQAKGEVVEESDSQARFLDNYDAKIASLENYTVTFNEPNSHKATVKEHSVSSGGMYVKLIKAKKTQKKS